MSRTSVLVFDLKCRALKTSRALGRLWRRPATSHCHLFVLCAPYAGSTLMHEILCSSPNVSPTNVFGVREGHGLPEVRRLVGHERDWDETFDYPWDAIRREWLKYWDTSRPVLLDKSPPNLLRAASLEAGFRPASFVVMTRDPYAHCESLMRRNGIDAAAAANLSLLCLRHQRANLDRLERVLPVRYEDLIADPKATTRALEAFVPEIGPLMLAETFTAHNREGRALPLTDFNRAALERLTLAQRTDLTRRFSRSVDLLGYFGYRLIP